MIPSFEREIGLAWIVDLAVSLIESLAQGFCPEIQGLLCVLPFVASRPFRNGHSFSPVPVSKCNQTFVRPGIGKLTF